MAQLFGGGLFVYFGKKLLYALGRKSAGKIGLVPRHSGGNFVEDLGFIFSLEENESGPSLGI